MKRKVTIVDQFKLDQFKQSFRETVPSLQRVKDVLELIEEQADQHSFSPDDDSDLRTFISMIPLFNELITKINSFAPKP